MKEYNERAKVRIDLIEWLDTHIDWSKFESQMSGKERAFKQVRDKIQAEQLEDEVLNEV